jgi:hypothetical protein
MPYVKNKVLVPAGPSSEYAILNPDASQVSKILDSPVCLDISMRQYIGTRPAGENFEAIFSLRLATSIPPTYSKVSWSPEGR